MLISREQKLNRWDSLPETLKEALASEENSHLLLDILKKEHISEEKFQIVALLIGDVIFGFKHPEDLGKELAENLNLAKPLAEALSEQINRKIFALIREDLRNVYSPVSTRKTEGFGAQPVGGEIKRIIEDEASNSSVVTEETAPKDLEIDLSTLEKTDVSAVAPMSPEILDGGLQNQEQAVQNLQGEDLAQIQEKQAQDEAPTIIHQMNEIKPLTKMKKSFGGLFGIERRAEDAIKNNRDVENPLTVKAKIEIPDEVKQEADQIEIGKTEGPKFKVVHYSDFGTSPDAVKEFSGFQSLLEEKGEKVEEKTKRENIFVSQGDREQIGIKEDLPIAKDYLEENGASALFQQKELEKLFSSEKFEEKNEKSFVYKEPTSKSQKNLEDIGLEDLPVGDDTIDLRSLDKI